MSTKSFLDWLTASTPEAYFPDDVLARLDWQKPTRGILHYQLQALSDATGVRFLYSPDVVGRGSCVVASGQALLALSQSYQMPQDVLCRHLWQKGFRASRMDFALDCMNSGWTVGRIDEQYRAGAIDVPTRSGTYLRSNVGALKAETLYFGSRESERYLRIYDKGVEQGVCPPGEWLRVELELKGKRCQRAWLQVQEFGTSEVGAAELWDFMKWDVEFWVDALAGRSAPAPAMGERPITNRRRWLLGQVAQAISNECSVDPSFWETLGAWVGELNSGK